GDMVMVIRASFRKNVAIFSSYDTIPLSVWILLPNTTSLGRRHGTPAHRRAGRRRARQRDGAGVESGAARGPDGRSPAPGRAPVPGGATGRTRHEGSGGTLPHPVLGRGRTLWGDYASGGRQYRRRRRRPGRRPRQAPPALAGEVAAARLAGTNGA